IILEHDELAVKHAVGVSENNVSGDRAVLRLIECHVGMSRSAVTSGRSVAVDMNYINGGSGDRTDRQCSLHYKLIFPNDNLLVAIRTVCPPGDRDVARRTFSVDAAAKTNRHRGHRAGAKFLVV